MFSKLQDLKFVPIKKVKKIHDYLTMTFSNGVVLNIYNKFSYSGKCDENIFSIEGKYLISVLEIKTKIEMKFSNEGLLVISLLDDDFRSPEAMELIIPGFPRIIWN